MTTMTKYNSIDTGAYLLSVLLTDSIDHESLKIQVHEGPPLSLDLELDSKLTLKQEEQVRKCFLHVFSQPLTSRSLVRNHGIYTYTFTYPEGGASW